MSLQNPITPQAEIVAIVEKNTDKARGGAYNYLNSFKNMPFSISVIL